MLKTRSVLAVLAMAAILIAATCGGAWAVEQSAGGDVKMAAQPAIQTGAMPDKLKTAINKSLANPEYADKTQKAVSEGIAKRGDEPGFLGIHGAPSTSFIIGFLWAIWVGWIFSTVGAFGGIMAGVGHITIFGLGDYAKSFGKGNPVNKLLTDSIRVSNQWLVGLAALLNVFNYYRMGRLVLPLGLCLAVGSVAGSYLIPELTAGKVSLKDYIGFFGLCVLLLGFILLYETTPKGQASKKEAKAAAAEFERQCKLGGTADLGVKVMEGGLGLIWVALAVVMIGVLYGNLVGSGLIPKILVAAGVVLGLATTATKTVRFTFCGVEFSFKGYIPIVGGLIIAALASFLGVGGGFLFVPFLTSVAGLPMFLVAGTSGLAVLVGMIISIFTYMVAKGVVIQWSLIAAELVGIFIGAMVGPRTSKYIPDKWLKIIFVILAFYVGIRYATKGFLGYSILPPG